MLKCVLQNDLTSVVCDIELGADCDGTPLVVDKKFKMFCFHEFLYAEINKESIVGLYGPAQSFKI